MSRKGSTCRHVKRAEIGRRLAAGEPGNQIAQDYGINPPSLHRQRAKYLRLALANTIMKDTAGGTPRSRTLPSKDEHAAMRSSAPASGEGPVKSLKRFFWAIKTSSTMFGLKLF